MCGIAIGRFFLFFVRMEESKNLWLDFWTKSFHVFFKEKYGRRKKKINQPFQDIKLYLLSKRHQ